MRLIKKATLIKFYEQKGNEQAKQPLLVWHDEVRNANWKNFNEVKSMYRSADVVGNNRMVFNICGNKYRLVAAFNFKRQICFVKWLGTHKAYDKINVTQVEFTNK